MATTKQILALQSDQILNAPVIGTKVDLKDSAATQKLIVDWTEPVGADRTLQLRDPGANDFFVYENLAQTLTNKTLGAGTVIADLPEYARLLGRLGGQVLNGGTAAGNNLDLSSTTNASKGVINALDNIVMAVGKEVTGLPATPSGATAATSKAYVDSVASGTSIGWREILLTVSQLDNTNDAIAQATVMFFVNNPISGDTLVIRDGVVTETFLFAGVSAPFQPQIGGTPAITMANLASRINTDSTRWFAVVVSTFQSINAATGTAVVIYRRTPTATVNDRIHGTFTTPADAKYVNFAGQSDYQSSTTANVPGGDPGVGQFGFGRITSSLQPSEAHIVRAEDQVYLWDADAGLWVRSVPLATSGAGGAIIGSTTFDASKGLLTTAGVTEVKIDNSTITFNGSGQLQTLRTQDYLSDGVFGNAVGTVFGDVDFPSFASDFELFYRLSSTTAASQLHVAFEGRLNTAQTQINTIHLFIKGTGASPQYNLKVYAEGSGATPVFTSGLTTAPGVSTAVTVLAGSLSAQPTTNKRFFVVIEAFIDASESVSVSRPYVIQN